MSPVLQMLPSLRLDSLEKLLGSTGQKFNTYYAIIWHWAKCIILNAIIYYLGQNALWGKLSQVKLKVKLLYCWQNTVTHLLQEVKDIIT